MFGSVTQESHVSARTHRLLVRTFILAIAVLLLVPAGAQAASARVAALQVALRAHGVYGGTIDGLSGPATTAGLKRLQQRRGLTADGVVGPLTRRALGVHGRHPI